MEPTYSDHRARFRDALPAHAEHEAHRIDGVGPDDEELTVDVARIGARDATRLLIVMSGVHGVEGFAGSTIQCDLLRRLDAADLGSAAVLLLHAVNPYGMAWWRRQNESNVDLNRNWDRAAIAEPPRNTAYDELHHLLCPDGPTPPAAEPFLAELRRFVETRGPRWVKAAISVGQYHHPDGLYFGGERTEASTAIVADVVARHAARAELVVTVDLHTGHGAWGSATLLSDAPSASPRADWLRATFPHTYIEHTSEESATTPWKRGQIAVGLAELLPDARYHSATFELGTVSDARMIVNERAEHWAHRHGSRGDAAVEEIRRAHLRCSAPDDDVWLTRAREHGRVVLDDALRAVAA
jgi:predicted deacylase